MQSATLTPTGFEYDRTWILVEENNKGGWQILAVRNTPHLILTR